MLKLESGKIIYNVLEKNVKTKIGVRKSINGNDVKFLGLIVSKEGYFIQVPEFYLKENSKINSFRNNKVWNITIDPKIEQYEIFSLDNKLVKSIREITFENLETILLKMEKQIESIEPIVVKKGNK